MMTIELDKPGMTPLKDMTLINSHSDPYNQAIHLLNPMIIEDSPTHKI